MGLGFNWLRKRTGPNWVGLDLSGSDEIDFCFLNADFGGALGSPIGSGDTATVRAEASLLFVDEWQL